MKKRDYAFAFLSGILTGLFWSLIYQIWYVLNAFLLIGPLLSIIFVFSLKSWKRKRKHRLITNIVIFSLMWNISHRMFVCWLDL